MSIDNCQLDVEGSEQFIARYEEPLQRMLDRLAGDNANDVAAPSPQAPKSTRGHKPGPGDLEFGEALHLLGSTSGTDRILLAGKFVQDATEDRTFGTGEASQMLIDQGVKLANPSTAMKRNLTSKRVFKIGREFRISKTGEDHLASLLQGDGDQSP
ncbi:MAG: hypothetical protein F4Z00_14635 [Acidimicrobiaceae bacterium]|nr:hypothetical protein [Acidimicrobiaceae bacterium]MXZ66762.1 hypothetical protein [Acidimicrobiaceae bacterium]MYF32866.1 hypothetical protein [Acidimicrobiaceae bacterium]MYG77852.1 hypothetical protein [Acidimicrobiaceae bacterium]MYJ29073.1 hypothetical protein [Acidimicrobiaceae bacterium]